MHDRPLAKFLPLARAVRQLGRRRAAHTEPVCRDRSSSVGRAGDEPRYVMTPAPPTRPLPPHFPLIFPSHPRVSQTPKKLDFPPTHAGEEENFIVTTSAYRPPFIRCQSQPPSSRPVSAACATVLKTMNASTDPTSFATGGAGQAQETLPQTLTEPTGRCSFTVGLTAPQDSACWHDVWQAAVALDGMCARKGQAGLAEFLGPGGRLRSRLPNEWGGCWGVGRVGWGTVRILSNAFLGAPESVQRIR